MKSLSEVSTPGHRPVALKSEREIVENHDKITSPKSKPANQCYICQSTKINFDYRNQNGYRISKCLSCNLLWVNQEITPKELEEFYNRNYFYNPNSPVGYLDYLSDEPSHRQNARELLETLGNFTTLRGSKVLDIGCAFGFLIDEARNRGANVLGLELSDEAYNYASDNLGLPTIKGDFHSIPTLMKFDIILLVGVIEHLRDPREVLDKVKSNLSDNGIFVITTLDTKALIPAYSLKPPEHLFYFSHVNLTQLLVQNGYEVLSCKPYFVRYKLFDILHRVAEYSGLTLFTYISKFLKRILPEFSLRILTNEMIMVVRKQLH